MPMDIVKTDGTSEPFSSDKFCLSLRKAGAPRDVADSICKNVQKKINPHDSTNHIFRKALKYLVREDMNIAARYSLKRGLEALGPAGFVFEQYLEAVLQSYGFKTKRNQIVKGHCISHEIDVFAKVGSKHFFVEAKYHNQPGIKTHVNTIMHVDARLIDIAKKKNKDEGDRFEHGMWVITNTKFTETAIEYAKCRGIRLTGWNYPRGESLEEVIVQKKMYPITIIPCITKKLLPVFAEHNLVLAQDLLPYREQDLIQKFSVSESLARRIVREVQGLLEDHVK